MKPNAAALLQLRAIIPVGITDGNTILEATDFNVSKAVVLIEADYLNQVMRNSIFTAERALELLKRYKYDVDRVLEIANNEIEEQYFTETEIIFRKCGNDPKEIVNQVAMLIGSEAQLAYYSNHLPETTDVAALREYQQAIFSVYLFLEQEDYEGPDHALWVWKAYVSKRTEKLIGAENIGSALRLALSIRVDTYTAASQDNEGFQLAEATLKEDDTYTEALTYYQTNKEALINKLVNLIRENLDEFS